MTGHHALTQATVTVHKAEQGGDSGPGRGHTGQAACFPALWHSASHVGSLWPAQRQPCGSWENNLVLQVLFLPLVPTNLGKPSQGWHNTHSLHPMWEPPCSSNAPFLLPTNLTAGRAWGEPRGMTKEAPWIAQAMEGMGWDTSWQGFKVEGRLCGSRCGLPSPRTGCPGELRNLNSSAPSMLGNRQDQRQQESYRLMCFHVVSGQTCFQPA